MITRTQIMRLLKYRNTLKRMRSFGFLKAYSNNLGDAIGITSVQVRKDFSLFNVSGNKKGGYNIDALLEQINKILGKEIIHKVIIVGYGKIGRALSNYRGFENEGITVVAAFDEDEEKIGSKSNIPVISIGQLNEYVKENKIEAAILTVPDIEAQKVFNLLCVAGIKGVLNFAPIKLTEYPGCTIHDVNIAAELESLFYFISSDKIDKIDKII